MPDHHIHDRLAGIMQSVFDDPNLVVHGELTAADVEGWDSLSHINLIAAVEKEFKLRFTTSEIMALANVGDLESLIGRKLGA
jgi:acyl carrier protein